MDGHVSDQEAANIAKMAMKQGVKYDFKHFPGQNQAQFCWQKYNEYLHCLNKNDCDEDACKVPKLHYTQVCPEAWTDEWDDQRDNGVFLGVQVGEIREDLKKNQH
mmetsp:Transcript_16874/g.25410  ORF Transcript_16874/g.25410 Transcript_16874/m.25410 type:complete len:105 (-) Transcript_16874:116-430(-)|eukprot:CAMPEP_0185023676 /NCGR_PEP_ID=MMETSP1103-20130426/6322_1 /TAXON_ID=36769 /ORGANISM="Paraphysomonas bandaiensis, Strain Caron Lab Isolate" /LENGTH=104 /DNA_ID=CAMNT_0027556379 /DNA_START=74 /DNA_END=388 /DNA_ORIENTATION=+